MSTPKKKSGRKVRVAFRPNRSQPARVKDWRRRHDFHGEELEPPAVESVVAKGDLSRHRTVIEPVDEAERTEQHRPESPDARPSEATEGTPGAGGAEESGVARRPGTVIAIHGLLAQVDDGQKVRHCAVRRVLKTRRIEGHHPVAVGDRVEFTVETQPDRAGNEGVIESVAPRHSELKRRVGREDRTMVANVDQVVIVTSADLPAPKPHLIDRYIVAVLSGRMEPVVCMNKMDLDPGAAEAASEILSLYAGLGYRTVATSAVTGAGINQLRDMLRGKSSVVAGQSGVGKSSLLNALQPGLGLRVGSVIEATSKGRHTTSMAQLLRLDFGGYVVDTPGVKSFEIASVPLGELEAHFVEFADLIPQCKFPDCTHLHEPACAVRAAVENGRIDPRRYESYVRMFTERGA